MLPARSFLYGTDDVCLEMFLNIVLLIIIWGSLLRTPHLNTLARVREGLVCGSWHRFPPIRRIQGIREIRVWVPKLRKCTYFQNDVRPRKCFDSFLFECFCWHFLRLPNETTIIQRYLPFFWMFQYVLFDRFVTRLMAFTFFWRLLYPYGTIMIPYGTIMVPSGALITHGIILVP